MQDNELEVIFPVIFLLLIFGFAYCGLELMEATNYTNNSFLVKRE